MTALEGRKPLARFNKRGLVGQRHFDTFDSTFFETLSYFAEPFGR